MNFNQNNLKSLLSDEDVEQLWNQRAQKSSNGFVGAVYHLGPEFSKANKPIPFNVEQINNGMEYNNGVFLILKPGYYRMATNLKSRDKHLQYNIVKTSGEELIYTYMPAWDASSTYYVAELAMFDMISIELRQEITVGLHPQANLVQIEKIY